MIGTADSEPNSIFVFTGRVLDEHVGLQPTLNRQFDVAVGCWLNDEPVGYQGDGDLYRYASNRLVAVIHRTSEDGPILQSAEYVYDSQNRWIAKSIDADGAGPEDATSTYFVYDGNQIVLQIGAEGQVTNRYLWGPAVDQILADEQVQFDGSSAVLWTLTDHLNTVRDLAVLDADTGVTTIANHLVYDAFGRLTSQTDPTVMTLFGFTARPFDRDTGLQNNLNRWYDAETATWISEDPKGFAAGDANLYRYVENQSTIIVDPSGLGFWSNYWFYLRYPKRMDRDIQIAQNTVLVVAGAAGGTAAGIAAGAVVGAVGAAAGSNASATTIAGGLAGSLTGSKVGGAIGGAAGNKTAEGIAASLGGIAGGIGGANQAAAAMPAPPSPGEGSPRPPGWDDEWTWEPPTGDAPGKWRWFDRDGGEWRWHPQDQHHPNPHWDYNRWTEWNSQWENL